MRNDVALSGAVLPLADWLRGRDLTGDEWVAGWVRELNPEYVLLIDGSAAIRIRPAPGVQVGDLLRLQPRRGNEPLEISKLEIAASPSAAAREILSRWDELDEEAHYRHRYVALREPKLGRNLRGAARLRQLVMDYFEQRGFLYVDTPLLGRTQAEYTAEDYLVISRHVSRGLYTLPQSAQLYKQLLIGSGVWRYFQISRCFRDESERADTLREFNQIDVELAFTTESELLDLLEDLVCNVFEGFGLRLERPFRRMPLAESLRLYQSDKPAMVDTGTMLGVFITDMPMAKRDERGRLRGYHHPMMAPDPRAARLAEGVDLTTVRSTGFDLVLGGIEIASGNIRVADADTQRTLLNLFGMSGADQGDLMGSLLNALEFAFPPHGGFGLGFERLLGILERAASVKQVVAFPKQYRDHCPLTQTPFVPHSEVLNGCRQVLDGLVPTDAPQDVKLAARLVRRSERAATQTPPSYSGPVTNVVSAARYPLHIGGSFLPPPESFVAAVSKSLARVDGHQYAPVGGLPELRDALADWHSRACGRSLDGSQVLVTSGASEATMVFVNLVLDPSDAALLLSPHWPLIAGQIRARGARVDEVTFFEGGRPPSPERATQILERGCRPDTRLIYLATPNNPDGTLLTKATLSAVVEFARERDIWLLCDEVYDRLVYEPLQMTSAWTIGGSGPHLVTVHSFSKALGVPGARVGYMIADPSVLSGLEQMIRHASFCASPAFQRGCLAALSDEAFVKQQRAAFDQARLRSARALQIRPPDAGIFHFFPIRTEAAAVVPAILRDTGIAVMDGHSTGEAFASWLRVCFTTLPADEAEAAATALFTWLSERGLWPE